MNLGGVAILGIKLQLFLPEKYTILDVHFQGKYVVSTLSNCNASLKHMVEAKVWIAAYGLIHPDWSSSVIVNDLTKRHGICVNFASLVFFVYSNKVDRHKVNRDRKNAEHLTVIPPRTSKRRSLVTNAELKEVKKRLKKAKATPRKVANAINDDPDVNFSTSRSSIMRYMVTPLKRKQEGKLIV